MRENQGIILPFPQLPKPVVTVTLWQEPGRPSIEMLRARLASEGYQAVKWTGDPYQMYLPHAHIYSELLWLIDGSLTILLPAESRLLELNPGDRIEVPAGILHASQAGPEGALYLAATR
jgi:hypothetical protein